MQGSGSASLYWIALLLAVLLMAPILAGTSAFTRHPQIRAGTALQDRLLDAPASIPAAPPPR